MSNRIMSFTLMIVLLLGFCQVIAEEPFATPTDLAEEEIIPWDCANCGAADNTGNFCTNCGAPAPWNCPNCGAVGNTGNFCPNCGAAKPSVEATDVIQAGDTITFGTWEQDNNLSNGTEPIEWIVLEVQGDRAFVLSRYGLVHARYVTNSNHQTWANSTLRATLNQDFFNSAFTNEEKDAILTTHVDESSDQWDPNHPATRRIADSTDDRIYILTYAEIIQYFPTAEERKCYCTEYIRNHANRSDRLYAEGRTCWYWLRNPAYNNNAGVVDWDGSIDTCYMHHPYGVARPCCCVSLSALGFAPQELPAEEETPQEEETLSVGSIVTFGRYEQDNDVATGMEPIEWVILELDEEEGSAFLVSRYVLDHQPYNSQMGNTEWETCSMRSWLNGTFLNFAFTPAEQSLILLSDVDNGPYPDHPDFFTGGNNTQDKIYLLSYAEYVQYIQGEQLGRCVPTAYAISRGVVPHENTIDENSRDTAAWWLRSVSRGHRLAAYCNSHGNEWDEEVSRSGYGVRPCCRVNLAAFEPEPFSTEQDGETDTLLPGAHVTFGHYEQDNDTGNGPEPIEWIVLSVDHEAGRAMIVSNLILDCQPYHTRKARINWIDSHMRSWLNDVFLNAAFTPEEQDLVCLSDVDNSGEQANPRRPLGSDDTQDKVFLLSYAEYQLYANVYMPSTCVATAFAASKHMVTSTDPVTGELNGRWWLRSPGEDRTQAMMITTNGMLRDSGDEVSSTYNGIRPCCWVELSALQASGE